MLGQGRSRGHVLVAEDGRAAGVQEDRKLSALETSASGLNQRLHEFVT